MFARSLGAAALVAALLTAPLWPVPAQAQTPAFEPALEDVESLPPGPGRDETFYGCTACHAFKLVAAQGMTRERWDETIQWMIERHKMIEPAAEERKAMLDYLSENYPQRSPGGWRNPFIQ